ncbi:DUF19 domain-containing protein [Caenorhabditis elegans]|uniref:DUF19 domain-containing protein n=1 Tax=Caenorhabditis elegans TaxID=6239 RepID=Q9NAL1_CAEEL|nr:DUF19 domain-containing protein [Caenorhabditis elegans]CAB76734.2 DUF19 domain-containing protein [Caenorhabditis elegans]|eukprot:NP_503003.2 Uncharacterized protein CELE_Y116A8C.3 [Caenorhabditis elegans]
MKISGILTFLAIFGGYSVIFGFAAQEFGGMSDWISHHPSRILPHLTASCQKHEAYCLSNIGLTAHYLIEFARLLIEIPGKTEAKLINDLDSLTTYLDSCKDAECLIDFQQQFGREFEQAITKAGNIIRASEKGGHYAKENDLMYADEFFG